MIPERCDTTDLWILTRQVSVQLERAAEIALEPLGLTPSSYALLTTLRGHTRVTQQEVADLLGLTKSSISRQMDAAIAAGHLRPAPSPTSRRDRPVELTPDGERLARLGDEVVEAILPAGPALTAAIAALSALPVVGNPAR